MRKATTVAKIKSASRQKGRKADIAGSEVKHHGISAYSKKALLLSIVSVAVILSPLALIGTDVEWVQMAGGASVPVWDGEPTPWDGSSQAFSTVSTTSPGSAGNPYLIRNAGDLKLLADVVNSGTNNTAYNNSSIFYELRDDLLLNGLELYNVWGDGFVPKNVWMPIGNSSTRPFAANFDGGGHVISGIYINNANTDDQGLFGYVRGTSTVYVTLKNVGMEYSFIEADDYVGGIVGHLDYGNVTNCYNTGRITSIERDCGGVVGLLANGNVTNCYNTGTINTIRGAFIGGVVGASDATVMSLIVNCYNTGSVTSATSWAGGIAGTINDHTRVINCYNTGDVTSDNYVGGIAGSNNGSLILNCYNTGSVHSTGSTAFGISYGRAGGTVRNCYFLQASGVNEGLTASPGATDSGSFDMTGTLSVTVTVGAGHYSNLTDALNARVDTPLIMGDYSRWADPHPPILIDNPYNGIGGTGNPPGGIWDGTISSGFAGGTGTESDPYLISNGSQLAYLGDVINGGVTDPDNGGLYNSPTKYYAMTYNIDLNDTKNWGLWNETQGSQKSWTPIGTAANQFAANFDGCGYIVKGVYISTSSSGQGLFGYVAAAGSVSDVCVEESYIYCSAADGVTGGLVGYNYGTIADCHNAGTIVASGTGGSAGGLVGNNYGTVSSSFNTGMVNSKANGGSAGGLVCFNYDTIIYCYSSGDVTINTTASVYAGGVAAYSDQGSISNCYNAGAISNAAAGANQGGIVGGSNGGMIENCYNTGSVTGSVSNNAGGISGETVNSTDIINCYNTGKVTAFHSGGLIGSFDNSTVSLSYFMAGTATYAIGDPYGNPADTSVFSTSGALTTPVTINGMIKDNLFDAICDYVSYTNALRKNDSLLPFIDTGKDITAPDIKYAFHAEKMVMSITGTIYDYYNPPSPLGDVYVHYEISGDSNTYSVTSNVTTGEYIINVPPGSDVTITGLSKGGYTTYPLNQLPCEFEFIISPQKKDFTMAEGFAATVTVTLDGGPRTGLSVALKDSGGVSIPLT
ncbi:MAG: hypothetical protein FWG60_02240, partial [Methanomassiliicoccaceae archaeon]|nr:hypothetical protein [Methanomassiliicoccaceae archaeon]